MDIFGFARWSKHLMALTITPAKVVNGKWVFENEGSVVMFAKDIELAKSGVKKSVRVYVSKPMVGKVVVEDDVVVAEVVSDAPKVGVKK